MRYTVCFLMMYLAPLYIGGQVVLQTQEQLSGYANLPDERIYLHTNTSFLLTGEYLYYKVYCFDTEKGNLTQLSKVAYVALIGKGGEQIFKHKILLKSGQGYGDFFVPTEVASGGYKLVAYTNWMGNQDQADFFQLDVIIVNPYRSNQPEIQKSAPVRLDSLSRTTKDSLPDRRITKRREQNKGPLRLKLGKKEWGKRDKVVVSLESDQAGQDISGTYSLSVRKKESMSAPQLAESVDFLLKRARGNGFPVSVGDSILLPELRGELFQGEVVARDNSSSVDGLKIGVSIPGEDYVLAIVQTDDQGWFNVNVAKRYSGEKMFVQVLSKNPERYAIRIREPKILDYGLLDFKPIAIDLSMRDGILRRSVHNQIENSYFQFRPDSILSVVPKSFFDNKPKKVYLLDEYTRFKTMRETFVEIVQDVSSKRVAKDDYSIRVKGYDYATVTDVPPLLVLDGIIVQDHSALLAFDARKVGTIAVFRDAFIFGPEVYEGAVVLTTKEGTGHEMFLNNELLSTFDLLRPQAAKKYFVQRYDAAPSSKSDGRLPDDRLQLLWIPELNILQNDLQIEFFTSDVPGEFEIRLEGITAESAPVSIRESIFVE